MCFCVYDLSGFVLCNEERPKLLFMYVFHHFRSFFFFFLGEPKISTRKIDRTNNFMPSAFNRKRSLHFISNWPRHENKNPILSQNVYMCWRGGCVCLL